MLAAGVSPSQARVSSTTHYVKFVHLSHRNTELPAPSVCVCVCVWITFNINREISELSVCTFRPLIYFILASAWSK